MVNTVRLPVEERRALERAMQELGQKGAAARFQVNEITLVKAIAGVGVNRSTAEALRVRLLEAPKVIV